MLFEPESTIDVPFRDCLEERGDQLLHTVSKQIKLKYRLLKDPKLKIPKKQNCSTFYIPKDTETFSLAQPNVFKRDSEKEFFVHHSKARISQIKHWSERENQDAQASKEMK